MTRPLDPSFPMVADREYDPGLNIREYFAAQAMKGFLSSYTGDQKHPDPDYVGTEAVNYADALIRALNK